MNTLQIQDDSAPITARFQSIVRESLADLNMQDRSYFDHAQYLDAKATEKNIASKYYQKEAQYISQINKIVKDGKALMYTLYAFRSCGKAIPQVQSQTQENKQLLYETTCEVLRPGIYKMIHLMSFQDELNACFIEVMAGIIPDVKDRDLFPSDTYLLALANLLDLIISLDTMKNFKGSMSNDLSMYKRSKSMLAKDFSDPEIQVLPKLGFFLASKDQFTAGLKAQIATLNNYYEDIFCDMINLCADKIEANVYLQPMAKHIYLRAMTFAIFLFDGETDDMDFNKKKKFKVDRVGKILKANSVVPLFGDIAISLGIILAKAPHWNHAKFDLNRQEPETFYELQKSYLLIANAEADILQFQYLMTCLKKAELQLCYRPPLSTPSAEECTSCYLIVFTSINFLSSLTNKVLEQAAWKYMNPNQSSAVVSDPDNQAAALTAVYEQAVQFNYSPEEKAALLQYISMIKNLAGSLQAVSPNLQPLVNTHVYNYLQDFTRNQITDYLGQAIKKKKPIAVNLKNVRDALFDLESEKSGARSRKDPISHSQLYFARTMLDFMFNEKSKNMKGGLMKEKNFKDAQIAELQKFFDDSFHFTLMTDLNNTIRDAADLSNLWFKEFYLELTKQVQFRISTSLPWILAEFAIDTQDTITLQDVFYPLDLYNEAAYKTLYCLQSRYIFNEIEAEVNLCFDQMMFKLGKNIYSHYKKIASIRLLKSDNKLAMIKGKGGGSLLGGFDSNAFVSILSQKIITLIGRSVNINKILSQIMNQYLRTSIDVAISRYEASDLTYIMELESLLETSRNTHKLLSKHLELENFSDILKEVDECINPGENNGRIISHTLEEVIKDVVSNLRFNSVTSRFLKGDVFYADIVQRPKFPNARVMYLYGTKALSVEFALKHGLFKDFIGMIHFSSLFQVIGMSGFAVLLTELLAHIKLIIDHTMEKFVNSILELAPYPIQFPIEFDSLSAMYSFLENRHDKLINCKFLKSEILQAFREIGNAISIIKFIEDTLNFDTSTKKILINDVVSYDTDIPCYLNKFEAAANQLNESDDTFSYAEWMDTFKRIIREPNSKSMIMKKLLQTISKSISDMSQFKEGESLPFDRTFCRAWSSLSFSAAMPQVGGEKKIRELFGDGLPIAGATLLFSFSQYSLFPIIDINNFLWCLSETNEQLLNSGNQRPEIKLYLANARWFLNNTEDTLSFFKNIKLGK